MDTNYEIHALRTERIQLPSNTNQHHDIVLQNKEISETSYWEHISLLASDYRSSANLYYDIYVQSQESIDQNDTNEQQDGESAFLDELEINNQLRLASHFFTVSLYHLMEKIAKRCCILEGVGLTASTLPNYINALETQLRNTESADYSNIVGVSTSLRLLANDIKHDGLIGVETSNNVPYFRNKKNRVIPDLTDFLVDQKIIKKSIKAINTMILMLDKGESNLFISI